MEMGLWLPAPPTWWRPQGWYRIAAWAVILSTLGLATFVVYATGGTQFVYVHLLYVPALLGALFFGVPGGVVGGVLAGLAVGPWMPLDVEAGTAQPASGWLIRMGAFTLAGLLAGASRTLANRYVEDFKNRLRYENAVSRAAELLLGLPDETAIHDMVHLLREALDLDNVYYGENVQDPELGLCWSLRWDSVRPGLRSMDPESWERIPYAALPAAYEALADGRPATRQVNQLSPEERRLYEENGIRSVLSIPIRVEGEWLGTLGFAHMGSEDDWSRYDTELLRLIAQMVGVFLERVNAQRRLEGLVRSRDEFVASVSHTLRTPLSAVLGFATELRDGSTSLDEKTRTEFLNLIVDASSDLTATIENLLVAARAEIGTLSVMLRSVDLPEVVTSALVHMPVGSGRPAPTASIDPEARTVKADPLRLQQVLRNLIRNGLEHGQERVTVTCRRIGEDRVSIAVSDDGAGVPREEWQRIFEPYYRLRSDPGGPEPLGLGLSVSRTLVHLMGGDLVYRREKDQSMLEFTLEAGS